MEGVVEWWSGGVVEWWSGGVVEWWSGGKYSKCLNTPLLHYFTHRARRSCFNGYAVGGVNMGADDAVLFFPGDFDPAERVCDAAGGAGDAVNDGLAEQPARVTRFG